MMIMQGNPSYRLSYLFNNRRWHDVAYWGLLLVACVTFYVMNCLTTLKEDDMAFSLIEGVWRPVTSLLDLLHSHVNLYKHANGRTANLVAALFCALLGKGFFNVVNTLVFALLAHLLSLLSTGRRSLLALAMFLVAIGTCYPVPGETMLWLDGSCNYMWAITLSLLLIRYLQVTNPARVGWGRGLLLVVASVVAGSFNEAISFGVFMGLCLYCALSRDRLNARALLVLFGYLLGILVIALSPGAWQRAADGGISVNMGMADLLHSRWFIFSEKMMRFYLPIAAALVGVVAIAMRRGAAVLRSVWTYIFLGLAIVMFALGQTSERAYAPLCTIALLIVMMAAHWVLKRLPWCRLAAIVLCLGLAGFTAARGVAELKRYKAYDDRAVSEIVASPDQAVLRQRVYDGYSRFIKPMNFISSSFFAHEVIYRAYFGKKNVQFVSDSVYVRYYQGRLLDGACLHGTGVQDSSHPSLIGNVYFFDDQQYIAIEFTADAMPCSFQTAQFHEKNDIIVKRGSPTPLEAEEQQRRRDYGITIDYDPAGFYPLEYQGKCYLICKAPDAMVGSVVFPLSLTPGGEVINIEVKL